MPLSVKMEEMLRVPEHRRRLHLISAGQPDDTVMGSEDMKIIYNTWRKDVQSWMRPSTLEMYYWWLGERRNQQAHRFAARFFNTYLFQLSGCKFLLHKLIKLPREWLVAHDWRLVRLLRGWCDCDYCDVRPARAVCSDSAAALDTLSIVLWLAKQRH